MRSQKMRFQCLLILFCVLSLGVVGCAKKQEGLVAANVGEAITETEVKQFANELEKKVKNGNSTAFTNMIDTEALGDTALAGMDVSDKNKREAIAGLKNGMTKSTSLGGEIVRTVQKGGTFRLLRTVTVDGKQRARFRLVMPEMGGINYMDFVLARREGGGIRAVDIYIFASGEMLSTSMHRLLLPLAQKQGLLARLRQEDKEYLDAIKSFGTMSEALRTGRPKDALAEYNSLPVGMQNDKMVQIIRLRAASEASEPEYLRALEKFQKDFQGDPAADMMSIDYYTLRKDYPKTIEMIERLDKAIGGDPALSILKAIALGEAGKSKESIALLQAAVKEMPDDVFAHQMLLGTCLNAKVYEPIPAAIDKLKALGEDMADPKDVDDPVWKAFAQSPQYRQWKQSQKSP